VNRSGSRGVEPRKGPLLPIDTQAIEGGALECCFVHFLQHVFWLLFPHKRQDLLGDGIIPDGSEGLTMKGRGAMLAQGGEVVRGAVSLVRSQSVHGKDRVPVADHAIAFDLGQTRCGGDGSRQCVTVDDCLLG
jgi:hypothetical protein